MLLRRIISRIFVEVSVTPAARRRFNLFRTGSRRPSGPGPALLRPIRPEVAPAGITEMNSADEISETRKSIKFFRSMLMNIFYVRSY